MIRNNPATARLEVVDERTGEVVAWLANEERQRNPASERLFYERLLKTQVKK